MKDAKYILLFLLSISLLFSATDKSLVLAQNDSEPTSFKNVQLWINPEYDDPRLLVMLEGKIDGVEAPARVRFLVPKAAEMYSAGSMDAQGVYSGGPPDRQPSGIPGWDEISYEVKTDTFRVEYYDSIILGNPEKSISYDFRCLYPISGLEVIVQQPRKASDFTAKPAGQGFVDNHGFNSFQYTYAGLDEGLPLHFDITYKKSDRRPSLDITDSDGVSTVAAIIAIVVLAVVIVGFFWLRSRSVLSSRAERRRLVKSTTTPRSAAGQAKPRFCTQCGKPLEGSYKFCPYCGAKP